MPAEVRLGLRENLAQFSLLVAVNAFVGAMVGLERSALPLVGREEFDLASSTAVLSFIVAFGLVKALTNLGAGALAERIGRRRLLIAGWAVALPVPVLIAAAPSWGWVVAANVLLGVNQGLAWSMTVVMKIDLVGPRRRGFALGLNEAAGYGGVALAAGLSGLLAAEFAARDVLAVAGAAIAGVAFCSQCCSSATPARTSPSSRPSTIPTPTAIRPAAPGVRAGQLPRARPALLPRRRASSTTSTTGWPGGSCRCSWPPTAPGSPRSAGRRGLSRRLERRADRHRRLVGRDRAQAADRRRDGAPGGRARCARAERGRDRRRGRGRRPARPRDGAGLPDADRRDLRRGLPRRPRARRRRIPLLARHGLRDRRPDRGRRRRRARLRRRDRARRRADRRIWVLGAIDMPRSAPSRMPDGGQISVVRRSISQ